MSYYYYQLRQGDEKDDSVCPTGSLRQPNRGSRQSPSCQQYQHYHNNRPYRPRASTDSIPFADADTCSGKLRIGMPLRDAGTSSSEETVNRQTFCANKPRTISSAGTSLHHRRPCPPPPPSPPATFLDSEDATSLNNLLDALDDIDVVEEDRCSSLTTTGSSRADDEPAVLRNGPTRPTLASILVSIPPPPTPPPPEKDTEQDQVFQRNQQRRLGMSSVWSATVHSKPTATLELPPPPPPPPPLTPPEENSAQTVST